MTMRHTEPDREGDMIHCIRTAIYAEAVVVLVIFLLAALMTNGHAIWSAL